MIDSSPTLATQEEVSSLQAQLIDLRLQLSTAVDDIRMLKEQMATLTRRATRLYLFAGCAALNSCNLGFDIGVSSDVALELQDVLGLSDFQTEFFMGAINLFAIIGSLMASFMSDWLGRRRAFAVAAVGFEIGIILMATSQSYAVLMVGRAIVGLGVGFGLAVDPVRTSSRGRCPALGSGHCAS